MPCMKNLLVIWTYLKCDAWVRRCSPLQWCHNGRDSVPNHQPYDFLLNGLFKRRSKKISKLRVTGLCAFPRKKWPVTRKMFPFDDVIMQSGLSLWRSLLRPLSSWWRHHMEIFSMLLALWVGNSPVTGEFPSQRFDVFFDLRLNKRLGKQSRRRWFEMTSRSLWRHCNAGAQCLSF